MHLTITKEIGIFLFCLIQFWRTILSSNSSLEDYEEETRVLAIRDILKAESYDSLRSPVSNGSAAIVKTYINIVNVRSVDIADMSFSTEIVLCMSWRDWRLTYPTWMEQDYTNLRYEWKDKIWIPNIYFENAIKGSLHRLISPSVYLWMSRDLHVVYTGRISLELSCEMKLEDFPHDEQECHIVIMSLTHNTKEMVLKWMWSKNSLFLNRHIGLPQFEIKNLNTSECDAVVGTVILSCLKGTMTFQRRAGYYIINVYIPCVLIVFMSMLTFWIPPDAVPARITLGVTSLLTIITKQYQAALPSVSYVVALNIWLSGCIGFVFFSLLEYAIVIGLITRQNSKEKQTVSKSKVLPMVQLKDNGTWNFNPSWDVDEEKQITTVSFNIRYVDYFSRVFFPLAFFSQCSLYWALYY